MATPQTLREWLRGGPFALAMSSGFFGFFAHAGFMTVLEDEGLLPERVSGASAGALVGGLWASGVDAPRMRDELMRLERAHFWDPAPGPGLLRGRLFRRRIEAILPITHFEETRIPVTLSVYDIGRRATRVVRSGLLAPAIQASCAVPLLFRPVMLDGRPSYDGGILDRPGIAGLPPRGRVLFHHLASKSPWRFALPIPKRDDMTTVVLPDLPRVGPFRLPAGAKAFDQARTQMKRALNLPKGEVVLAA